MLRDSAIVTVDNADTKSFPKEARVYPLYKLYYFLLLESELIIKTLNAVIPIEYNIKF